MRERNEIFVMITSLVQRGRENESVIDIFPVLRVAVHQNWLNLRNIHNIQVGIRKPCNWKIN